MPWSSNPDYQRWKARQEANAKEHWLGQLHNQEKSEGEEEPMQITEGSRRCDVPRPVEGDAYTPVNGDLSRCKSCGREIIWKAAVDRINPDFRGYWDHMGDSKPRHPAQPCITPQHSGPVNSLYVPKMGDVRQCKCGFPIVWDLDQDGSGFWIHEAPEKSQEKKKPMTLAEEIDALDEKPEEVEAHLYEAIRATFTPENVRAIKSGATFTVDIHEVAMSWNDQIIKWCESQGLRVICIKWPYEPLSRTVVYCSLTLAHAQYYRQKGPDTGEK